MSVLKSEENILLRPSFGNCTENILRYLCSIGNSIFFPILIYFSWAGSATRYWWCCWLGWVGSVRPAAIADADAALPRCSVGMAATPADPVRRPRPSVPPTWIS